MRRFCVRILIVAAPLVLAGCAYLPLGDSEHVYSSAPSAKHKRYASSTSTSQQPPNMVYHAPPGQMDPKTQPYSVMGKTYWPVQSAIGFEQEGYASWYGMDFHGKKTATGDTYDMFSISAAHKTLPLGSRVRVTNLDNGRQLELTINDRGPFVDGRVIDLSYASARLLGMADSGLAHVRVEGVADNPLIANGSYKGVAVASAAGSSRKSSRRYAERDLSDDTSGRSRSSQSAVVKAPKVAAADASQGRALASSPDGRFSVQVGAFSQNENARRVKDHLVQAGFSGARIVRAQRGDRELSVVQAGSYDAREDAEQALRAVREEFPASFISSGV